MRTVKTFKDFLDDEIKKHKEDKKTTKKEVESNTEDINSNTLNNAPTLKQILTQYKK